MFLWPQLPQREELCPESVQQTSLICCPFVFSRQAKLGLLLCSLLPPFALGRAIHPAKRGLSDRLLWCGPPVVLMHGQWGSTADWETFTPFAEGSDPRFYVRNASYDTGLGTLITASDPVHNTAFRQQATSSALGLAFNAPVVRGQIELALENYRDAGVAAAQVDVVAHSMGGLIIRKAKRLSRF